MGGKGSKPVTGENGVITYKVDVYGANIRQKFDSGDLQLSNDQLTFTGAKSNFQWPIKELKRYGSAKKVFTIEINEHDAQLDSREIKFKSKYATSIYEQFKNKIAELEGGPEEKKDAEETGDGKTPAAPADAANATDKTVDNEQIKKESGKNGSVHTDKEVEENKTDNTKESEKGEETTPTPTTGDMSLQTNPTITVQTPSPTTEKPESDPTTPAESKEEPQEQESEEKSQETVEKIQESEEKTQESADKPQEEEPAAEEKATPPEEEKAAETEAPENEPAAEETNAEEPPQAETVVADEAPATVTESSSPAAGNEETGEDTAPCPDEAPTEENQEEKEVENQSEEQPTEETKTEEPAAAADDAPSAAAQEGD